MSDVFMENAFSWPIYILITNIIVISKDMLSHQDFCIRLLIEWITEHGINEQTTLTILSSHTMSALCPLKDIWKEVGGRSIKLSDISRISVSIKQLTSQILIIVPHSYITLIYPPHLIIHRSDLISEINTSISNKMSSTWLVSGSNRGES